MSLDRAWALAFALIPLAWAAWERRRGALDKRAALKHLSFLCLAVALASPHIVLSSSTMMLSVLVDTSDSVSDADLVRATQLVSAIEAARGRNRVQIFSFAREPLSSGLGPVQRTSGEAGQTTDIESALNHALAAAPADLVPRIALISDGKENRGGAARAAALLRKVGIPVDVFPLAGRPKPEATIDAVSFPNTAFTGEQFPIDLTVRSPRSSPGLIEIAADGKPLGQSPVEVQAGAHPLRIYASISEPGIAGITGTLRLQGFADARFSAALRVRRPRLLFISEDPPGTEDHLLGALRAARFEIDQTRDASESKLDDYQIVILNNWDIESLDPARKQEIEMFVKGGGGLLVIGGENNRYPERDRQREDPLDRVLPAKIAPPREPEVRCVALIIDKSASMGQRGSIDLARLSAIGVIDNLRPMDMLGVMVFDYDYRWLIPVGPVEDRERLVRLVSGITPGGGTNIPPALADAFEKVAPLKAAYKHIVLLTDGISQEGDSYDVAKRAGAMNVTISTVGLGSSVNRKFLSNLAVYSNGSSYFLDDPSGLERILLRDLREHTQTTFVEGSVTPAVLRKVELLEGVGMDSAPPLAGYVRYSAKPAAETIMQVDDSQPLLARWQYGLGRAAVFTSDAKSRWASQWVTWSGFDRFWSNIARDLLPRTQAGEATVEYDPANGELEVEYRLGPDVEAPATMPEMFAFGPEGFQRPVELRKSAERWYRGRVAVEDARGLYLIRPVANSRAFPEAGVYLPSGEQREFGADERLLRQIAESTGGRFNPEPRRVFDPGGRTAASVYPLWPALLGLALALNLTELVLRKWRGIKQKWA